MATASHFFGIDGVLDAYDARGLDTWALFHGKNFMTAGVSPEELGEFLQKLSAGAGNTVFTLKVYKEIEDPDDITDKTPSNGSFNFMLDGGMFGRPQKVGGYDAIAKRLDDIENKISGNQHEEKSIGAILYDHLENPEKLATLVGTILSVLRPPQPYGMGRMAQPIGYATNQGSHTSPENTHAMNDNDAASAIERLSAAIDILEKRDPKIVDHLEKLAQLSQSNPQLFNMLIRQLDTM